MVIRCDYCKKEIENNKSFKTNYCDSCVKDKEIGMPIAIDKIYLKGYGEVSVKRIEELKRRVILPYRHDPNNPHSYQVGRMGENGKIQERVPTY